MPGSSSAVIGLPHHSTRSASRSFPRTRFSAGLVSRLQLFRYVQASQFARLPDRSYRCELPSQGSRGFYIRAERASLPSHASDMLPARLQAIGGTRTFTSLDSQSCRLLQCLTIRTVSRFPATASSNPACGFPALGFPACFLSRFMGPIVPIGLSPPADAPDSR